MNALDRSTAPLDSALARRFEQIQIDPDYSAFANHLQPENSRDLSLDPGAPIRALNIDPAAVSPEALSLALLKQVNTFLRGALGDDFQLGPGYIWRVGEVDPDPTVRIDALAKAWDSRVIPKLRELFRSRGDQLDLLLRPTGVDRINDYPYEREEVNQRWEQRGVTRPLTIGSLTDCDEELMRQTLHAIATQSVP